MAILNRFRKALNVFVNQEQPAIETFQNLGVSSTVRPDRQRLTFYNDRSLISAIYTRLSIDVAGIDIRHIELDEVGQYKKDLESGLNDCLTFEPNLDQGPRAFRQDVALTMFDKGVAVIVPIDTDVDPAHTDDFDIYSLRVGHVVNWYPRHVKVSVYNDKLGVRQELTLEKRHVAIVENPLSTVMNEPNSTLQRLVRKLSLLDSVDEATGSGKLDIIIQLPYVIKSEARQQQAERRRQDIEFQLRGSQYGIAYTDATEKITQLNRPAENNLLKQIEYLTNQLFTQLGLTPDVMNGTADEATMIAYYNRTVEPILDAFIQAMQRALLGATKTKAKQRIKYFRDPFKLLPLKDLAEIGDKFSRNEILTSNEIRGILGFSPHKDPKANQLMNSNMPQPGLPAETAIPSGPSTEQMDEIMNSVLDELKTDVDKILEENV